jgi:hypothetical protein
MANQPTSIRPPLPASMTMSGWALNGKNILAPTCPSSKYQPSHRFVSNSPANVTKSY